MTKTKRLATLAVMLGISLILFVIEGQIPPLVPLPGVKLGLANLITLAVMALFDRHSAAEVLFLRIVLGSILTGSGMAILYSLAGGIAAFAAMALTYPLLKKELWAVSAFGAAAHHCGQIAVAALILRSASVLIYLPILLTAGIISGVFTGLCIQFLLRKRRTE